MNSTVDPAVWQLARTRAALASRDMGDLFKILQARGLSQRAIAELTGQHQSEIHEIINGRAVTSLRVLERIADGLGIPREHIGLSVDRPCAPVVAHGQPEEIRALRAAMRLSVREFADHLGVSDRMVSKWLAGATPRPDLQRVLDTALTRSSAEVQQRYANWPSRSRAHLDDDPVRWVVHIPCEVHDESAATDLADEVALMLAPLRPRFDPGEMSVSREDQQLRRVRVYCDRRLQGDERCTRRTDHGGGCAAG